MRIYILPVGTYWPDGRRLADCERTYCFFGTCSGKINVSTRNECVPSRSWSEGVPHVRRCTRCEHNLKRSVVRCVELTGWTLMEGLPTAL